MKHIKIHHKSEKGFTIVELMISTVIFSMIMVLCLSGMVQVTRAYYKGIAHSRTQEAGRVLMDEIAETIKLSGSTVSFVNPTNTGPNIDAGSVADGTGVFCAGNKSYTYALDRKVVKGSSSEANKEISNALVSEDVKCSDAPQKLNLNLDVTGNQRALLPENMRLTKFSITRVQPNAAVPVKSGSQLWKIEISIAYGDQDLLAVDGNGEYIDDQGANRVICKNNTGTEFCSIVEMSTIVSRRIG